MKTEIINQIVCDKFNMNFERIQINTRRREIVIVRQILCFFYRKYTYLSFYRIGQMLGKRDHATVLYSCRFVENLMSVDWEYKQLILELDEKFKKIKNQEILESQIKFDDYKARKDYYLALINL